MNKKLNIYVIVLLVVLLIIGAGTISYAYISSNVGNSSSKTDIYGKTDCINIDITSEVVNLDYKYPISDTFAIDEGHVKPVRITLHNTCQESEPLNYSVIITTFADSATSNNYIDASKMKVKIDKIIGEDTKTLYNKRVLSSLNKLTETSTTNELLNKELSTDERINDLTYRDSRVIEASTINNGDIIIYDTYLWISYDEANTNNITEGKEFKNLISVIVNNKEENVKGNNE